MSAVTEQPPAADATAPARSGSLLRAEFHRLRSRRFLQVLLALAVLGWVVAVIVALTQVGVPDEGDFAEARQRVEQEVAFQEELRDQCLEQTGGGEATCGPPATAENFRVEDFLSKTPFDFASAGQGGAGGFAGAAAIIGFLVGATWIGAEWSTRSLVALLFWIPQRLRVMAAKIAVLVIAAAVFAVLMQLAWLAMAGILDAFAGSGRPLPAGFWDSLLAMQGRSVLLVVLVALIGFGLANLTRNTGAALGIGFVYFSILETALRILRPAWEPWLLSNNAVGLVAPGGTTVFLQSGAPGPSGFVEPTPYVITNLQGGIYLGIVAVVAVGVGVVLFTRRDIH